MTKFRFALPFAAMLALAGLTPALMTPATAQTTQRLNPNTATADQLKSVAGLDAALIADIQKGKPYATMVDFNKVVSAKLNAEQAGKVYTSLWVPINLNTGVREEFALIPNLNPRMVREFFEYRPWTSMDQFNKEIGKYVDAAEVARLASYVTLK